ncbi:MAG: T9SS type A sorting domain-containing protein [Candidatus Kapaibacterium sp.]|nr:T9SS type A sorting domain-containing protein [Bacteroidota bacterium]
MRKLFVTLALFLTVLTVLTAQETLYPTWSTPYIGVGKLLSTNEKLLATWNTSGFSITDIATSKVLHTINVYPNTIQTVLFNKDGDKLFVQLQNDSIVFVYNTTTGQLQFSLGGEFGRIRDMDYSDSTNELAVSYQGNGVVFWSAVAGNKLRHFTMFKGASYAIKFIDGGKKLITSGYGVKPITVWDVITGNVVQEFLDTAFFKFYNGYQYRQFVCSQSDNKLCAIRNDGKLTVWDLISGMLLYTIALEGQTTLIAPSGRYCYDANYSDTIRVYRTTSGSLIKAIVEKGLTYVGSTFAGDTIFTWNYKDRTLKAWDINTNIIPDTLPVKGVVYKIEVGGNSSYLLLNSSTLLSYKSGKVIIHFDDIKQSKLLNSTSLVTWGEGNNATLWQMGLNSPVLRYTGHTKKILDVSFNAIRDKMVTGSDDFTAKIWDVKSGLLLHTLSGHEYTVSTCEFSTKGDIVVTSSFDKTSRVYDVNTGELLFTLGGVSGKPEFIGFNSTDKHILTGFGGQCIVWERKTGELVNVVDYGNYGAYSKERDLLIIARYDKGVVSTIDPYTGTLLDTILVHKDRIDRIRVGSTGGKVVTVGSDNYVTTAKVWSIINKNQIFSTNDKNFSPREAFLSPDDELIVVYSEKLQLHRVSTGKLITNLDGVRGKIINVVFSPNSDVVIATLDDGTVVSWDISKIVSVENQIALERDFTCYPNPASEQIEICKPMSFNESYATKYKLVDVSGRVVSNLESKEATNVLDVHGIPNGIYFLTAQQATTIKSTTITIIR